MEFRKSVKSDIPKIMNIIKQAQAYFKNQNIDQWQNGYPNEKVINNDIENDEGTHKEDQETNCDFLPPR